MACTGVAPAPAAGEDVLIQAHAVLHILGSLGAGLRRVLVSGNYEIVVGGRVSRVGRAKVIDFDYYQFIGLLRRASNAGARIEKNEAGWAEYIKAHGINEVAASAIARQRFENAEAVIISEGRDTDGLYFYSRNDEGCLRLVSLAE